MLEIKITVPNDGLFKAMRLLGSNNSKIIELITVPGVKIALKAEKLNIEWNAEGISELATLGTDQKGRQ